MIYGNSLVFSMAHMAKVILITHVMTLVVLTSLKSLEKKNAKQNCTSYIPVIFQTRIDS